MMKQTKLAKAIAFALAGAALSAGSVSTASAAVTTMYNLSSSGGLDNSTNTTNPLASGNWALAGATDGWTNAGISPSVGNGTGASKWAGTSGVNNVAFGYTGAHLNWGINISGGKGGNGEISTFDSFNRYGVYADIDTSRGAWSASNTGVSGGGWRHDLDVGLFKSDTSGLVTLSASGIQEIGNFGFTIFRGMDTVTAYGHHGQWNDNSWNTAGNPYVGGVDAGAGLSEIVARSVGDNPATTGVNEAANLNTISFNAVAGEYYTIFLGGYKNGTWWDTTDGYKLTVAQVPVPGAVWLFGSALAGLVGAQRRKRQTA